MRIKTNELFPPTFNDDFRDILKHGHTEYTEYGGRGSCKSSFISVTTIILLVQNPAFNALILRKTAESLRRSVFEQIKWAVDKLGLNEYFKFTVSPMQATYLPTGQVILFSGVDDPTRLKSLKTKTGYFAITWFEESAEFNAEEMENVKLTTMRGGDVFYIFDSFNPPSAVRNWKNEDVRQYKPQRLTHLSDYRTTPREWLGEAFILEAEQMRKLKPLEYDTIFLGIPRGTGRQVFENITLREITDEEISRFDYIETGIDWGYYPDPFAYGRMSYDAAKRTLYIFDELYLYKHGNIEASEALKDHLIDLNRDAWDSLAGVFDEEYKRLEFINMLKSERITADSAEPKSCADFRAFGWNLRAAIKGPGSLNAGFKWLQGLKEIVIDPRRCPHAADEFSLYEHDLDKRTGEVLPGYPQGQPDHFLALTRYACEHIWTRRGN